MTFVVIYSKGKQIIFGGHNLRSFKKNHKKSKHTVMKESIKSQRKWSAIAALFLAVVVTFMAAIQSYGVTSSEELIVYDVKSSLDRAYEEVIEEEFEVELPVVETETIKIFDTKNTLILTVVKEKNGIVQNEKAQKMLNTAEYLGAYSNTTIYLISE